MRHVEGERLGEFDLIARYFAPLATEAAALGLRDDAAVLRPPEGQEIVLSCDTIVEGVHFLERRSARDASVTRPWRSICPTSPPKGARPYVYLLGAVAAAPRPPPTWLEGFASGLARAAGGDRHRPCRRRHHSDAGPLSITVTALGLVPQGHAVLRHGAKQGDRLYVSGTIGDAYLGLRLLKDPALARAWGFSEDDTAFVIGRYRRPKPRTDLALLVRNFAQAPSTCRTGSWATSRSSPASPMSGR